MLTRDVYSRFLRPGASEAERAWFGRSVIVVATLLALGLVYLGKSISGFQPLEMIAALMFVAIGFSCQLASVALDVLFIQRGTRAGAITGMVAGIAVVFLFTPLPAMLFGLESSDTTAFGKTLGFLKRQLDVGFCGFVVNAAVFAVVSSFTRRPDALRVAEFKRIMTGPDQ